MSDSIAMHDQRLSAHSGMELAGTSAPPGFHTTSVESTHWRPVAGRQSLPGPESVNRDGTLAGTLLPLATNSKLRRPPS
jgi:hypothetical protein